MSERRRVGSKRTADGRTQPGPETGKLAGENGPEKTEREQKAEGTRWSTVNGFEWTKTVGDLMGVIRLDDSTEIYSVLVFRLSKENCDGEVGEGWEMVAGRTALSRQDAEVEFEKVLKEENQ